MGISIATGASRFGGVYCRSKRGRLYRIDIFSIAFLGGKNGDKLYSRKIPFPFLEELKDHVCDRPGTLWLTGVRTRGNSDSVMLR